MPHGKRRRHISFFHESGMRDESMLEFERQEKRKF